MTITEYSLLQQIKSTRHIERFLEGLRALGFEDDKGDNPLNEAAECLYDFCENVERTLGFIDEDDAMTVWALCSQDWFNEHKDAEKVLEAYKAELQKNYPEDKYAALFNQQQGSK